MNFSCQRCGRCCREIGIAWSELDPCLVSNHLNVALSDFLDAYGFIVNAYSNEIEPTEFGVTPCPFVKYDTEKSICTIYPVRPWICRDYPGPGTACRREQGEKQSVGGKL